MVDTPLPSNTPREALRAAMRQQRLELTSDELQQAGHALSEHALPQLSSTSHVSGYRAINGEIPLEPLFAALRLRGVITSIPVLHGQMMQFAPIDEHTGWQSGRYGLQEPLISPDLYRQPEAIDVVLVPLVAVDSRGNRLGMGGGFYDRTFAFRQRRRGPPWLFGVAHHFQQVNEVPADWWDVPLDRVITDHGASGWLTREAPPD